MLNVFVEIETRLSQITPAEMRRIEVRLRPKKRAEAVIGVIQAEAIKRLFVLTGLYTRDEEQAAFRAKFEADTREESAMYTAEATRAHEMSDLCRAVFWQEARNEAGPEAWREGTDVGVRAGWTMVWRKTKPSHPMVQLLGGAPEPDSEDD